MSAPTRAARRGGRVATDSPSSQPTTANAVSNMSPLTLPGPAAAAAASPAAGPMESTVSSEFISSPQPSAVGLGGLASMGSLSSFLENFGATPNGAAPTAGGNAVGVVRGRGAPATPHKATAADAQELKVRGDAVKERLATAVRAMPSATPAPAAATKHVPFDSPVSVIPEDFRVSAPVALLQHDAQARVLLVETTHHSAIAAYDDAVKSSSASVALWDGAVHRGDLTSSFIITHVHSFLLLIGTKVEGNQAPLGDFTHIFYVCSTGAVEDNRVGLRDTGINALMQQLLTNRVGYTTKLVFVGSIDLDQLRSAISPRVLHEITGEDFGDASSTTASAFTEGNVFGPEDCAALAGSSLTLDLAPINGSVPSKVTDNAIDVTSQIIQTLIAATSSTATRLVGVIFAPDANEAAGRLKKAVPSTVAAIVTDAHGFASDRNNSDSKHKFLVLSNALSRYAARQILPLINVIIDFGSERRQGATPKQEYPFLCRQTLSTTPSEAAARSGFSKFPGAIRFQVCRRPGVPATPTVGSPTAGFSPSSTVVSSSQLSVMDALLQISRLGLVSNPLSSPISHIDAGKRGEYSELSLARLAELCAVAAPVPQPGITFVGDLLGRIPLAIENAVLVLHGIITGLHDATTLVASILQCPIRIPATDAAEADKLSAKIRASADPTTRCSDVLTDAFVVLHALGIADSAQRDAYLADQHVSKRAFDEVVVTYTRVIRQVTDYLVDRTSGHGHSLVLTNPSAVRLQIEENANFLVYVIGASHAIKVSIVRTERDDRLSTRERGSLMFLRTAKEATTNSFVPSVIEWKQGNVVVPGQLVNSNTKFYLSSLTSLSHKFLWVALVLLNPTLEFDKVGPSSVTFAVTVNRQTRRFSTDVATSVRILDAREEYNRLLGCVLLRRSTSGNLTNYLTMLQEHGIRIHELRRSVIDTFVALTQETEITEVSTTAPVAALARSLHLAPLIIDESALANVAPASDVVVTQALRYRQSSSATGSPPTATAAAAATPSASKAAAAAAKTTTTAAANDDSSGEEESMVWAGGVIEEDGDEVVLEQQLYDGKAQQHHVIIEDD